LADDGTIYCIDTFSGSEEHKEMGLDFSGVKDRFKANTEEVKKPNQSIGIMDMPSHIGISKLMSDERIFDLVYVDGSHMAPDVMSDACMAFHLLETKGIMVFDDYLWKMEQNTRGFLVLGQNFMRRGVERGLDSVQTGQKHAHG
jgi:hypothetical protein